MKGYAVSGIPYAIREIKRFRVKSISNPDERDKCLLQLIFLKKNKKTSCKALSNIHE